MDIIHLTKKDHTQLILDRQLAICFLFLFNDMKLNRDRIVLSVCAMLFAQLIVQDVINRMAKNDDELDRHAANEALLLVAKLSGDSMVNNGSAEVMRLKLRSKKLKGVPGVKSLQIWEIQYWLKLGAKLSDAEVAEYMPKVLTWLTEATDEAFNILSKMSPAAMADQISEQLDLGFMDLNAPRENGKKKKK